MEILVLDLATLGYRFESGRSQLVVSAPGVPQLVCAKLPDGCSDREAVFLALDKVLASGRVPGRSGWAAVGLYNPVTGDVAVGAVPETVSYCASGPIPLPREGLLGVLEEDVLTLGPGLELTPVEPDAAAVQRALDAHRALSH